MTITGCTIQQNTSITGGGILNEEDLTIIGSTIQQNIGENGGGIDSWGTMTIISSIIQQNTSPFGGGIINWETLTITDSTIQKNTAVIGGGMLNIGTATVIVIGNSFQQNTATLGGAIYNWDGNSEIHYSSIISNSNIDVYNEGGSVNAEYNWWGTNFVGTNPLAAGRVNDLVDADPWLVLTLTTSNFDHGAVIRVDLLHDSQGGYHDPTGGHVPDGIPVTFNTNSGVLIPRTAYTKDGVAETIFKARHYGSYSIQATVDSQTLQTMNILRGSGSASAISSLTIISTIPGNNAIGVSLDVIIIVTYNQPITPGPGYNQIILKDENGNIIPITVTIENNQLIIKPQTPLKPNTKYTLTIPENAVKNKYGNGLPGPYTLNYTT